jgi:hypothetical protein
MIEPDFFAHLLTDMGDLIESRKSEMSAAELDRAISSLVTVASTCGKAAAYCHQMNFSDSQTRDFMRGVLQGFVEEARHMVGVAPGKVH